jgi:AraC family transcriptional regulator
MKYYVDSLHGTVLKNIVVAGFTLTETTYRPTLSLPKHSHQFAYFCFVLQGGFTEFYERQYRFCRPSTLIFHPSDESHSDYFQTGARCFNIQMDVQWVGRMREHSRIVDIPSDFHGGYLARLATKIYKEFRQTDELSSLIIEGMMLELLGEAARRVIKKSKLNPPPWLIKARELLQDQFCEPLTLSKIAGSVGVHETHLSREFHRYYLCTVGEYIRELRIEFAAHKLRISNTSLSEVALSTGFVDQSHFTKTFKHLIGFTPAAYRKTFRKR